MSWLLSKSGELPIGADAGSAVRAAVLELVKNKGGDYQTVLNNFIQGKTGLERSLTDALLVLVGKQDGYQFLGDLVVDLSDLEGRVAGRDYKKDGKISWGGLDWSESVQQAAPPLDLSLSVGAAVDAYFQVLKDDGEFSKPLPVTTSDGQAALGSLVFEGKLNASAGLKVTPGAVLKSASLSAEADAKRSFKVHMSYPGKSDPAGLALASALSRVPNIADLVSVSEKLVSSEAKILEGEPVAFEYSGNEGLGGSVGVKANVLIPNTPIPISISLGAKIKYGRGFSIICAPASSSPDPNDVRVTLKNDRSLDYSGDIGIGVKIGLSDLLPGAATDLVKHITNADKVISEINKSLKDAMAFDKWLKPGALVQKEIEKGLQDLFKVSNTSGDDDKKAAEVALPAFVALFGFSVGDYSDDNEAADALAEQATGLFSGLVDELFQVDDPNQDGLKSGLANALKTAFADDVVESVKAKVIEKIPNLQTKLSTAAKKLDAKAVSELQKALGKAGVTDKVELFQSYLGEARKFLKTTLGLIEKSQTQLLTAEISAWYKQELDDGFAFALSLDPDEKDACDVHRDIILKPGQAGDILRKRDDLPEGVILEGDWTRYASLHEETGMRWGLTLIDATLVYKKSRIIDVEVKESDAGIAAYSKGVSKEEVSFLSESRLASFVSAFRLWYSTDATAIQEASEANDASLKAEPAAAPVFDLTFKQTDNNLRAREVRSLLDKFKNPIKGYQLVTEETISEVANFVHKLEQQDGDFPASFSIALGIAPSDIERLVYESALHMPQIEQATIESLSYSDFGYFEDILDKAISGRVALDEFFEEDTIGSTMGVNLRGLGRAKVKTPQDVRFLIENLDALVATTSATVRSLGIRNSGSRQARNAEKQLMRLVNAKTAIRRALSIALSIFEMDPKTVSRGSLKRKQKELQKSLEPFLKAGVPWPEMFKKFGFEDVAPSRLVGLFYALSEVTDIVLGQRPIAIITVKPEKGAPGVFLSPGRQS
ncbi:MAG: hypothetical protein AAGI14_08665 [Pseudomonadota bacterium]